MAGGKKVALFIADLYNEHEFWYPFYRLQEAGFDVDVIGPSKGTFKSKIGLPADCNIDIRDVKASDYCALVIPGGYAPDFMRRTPEMVDFVRSMFNDGKVVAAICHAGWMLVSAGILKGRTVTSFFAIKDDLVNAGATWIDKNVVKDGKLITSRTPADLPVFLKTIIESIG